MNMQEILVPLTEKGFTAYPESYSKFGNTALCMVERERNKSLLMTGLAVPGLCGESIEFGEFSGMLCPLSHENASVIKDIFPWLRPISAKGNDISFGTGDRLGLVTGAHVKAMRDYDVFPVLAQQSKRELMLTGRSYASMLDDVMWQVFESGYRKGYAADGDHLKSLEDIKAAVSVGSTFITLDCSDYLPSKSIIGDMELGRFEEEYCGKKIDIGGTFIEISKHQLRRILEIYYDAISYAEKVYYEVISPYEHDISFELSVDETKFPTDSAAHFLVANELKKRGVFLYSIAPKFSGEFQKGIDYIGNKTEFRDELKLHVKIAECFGHKISIHSGSDKFSIFPDVGRECHGRFHLKTSGTSWVEAMRVVAMCDPALFRNIFKFACANFEAAKKYYHVSAIVKNVPDIDHIKDENLPSLLDQKDSRQVIHITYGALLQARGKDGAAIFKDDIYRVLQKNKPLLDGVITSHIKRHLQFLGLCQDNTSGFLPVL